MHYRSSQNTSSSSSGPSPNSQGFNEQRSTYVSGYGQASKTPVRDSNSSGANLHPGMSLQRNKFAPNGNTPIPMTPNMDWSATNRPAYITLLPNSVFGGIPPVSPFVASPIAAQSDQMNQMNQIPYVSTGVYQNFGSMVPGTYSSLPCVMNCDMQDSKQAVGQNENNHSFQYCPTQYVPTMDGTSLSGYAYPSMFPQVGPYSLPYQMMKTSSGYVYQDLDAITQQEPAIPRAVPAMWTNPSELTLAKCLENREGITNVYIRGFLPETTDEMLHEYAVRFGKIERCKAIVDLDTGLCKGFGFVQYYTFESCENCIRGFFFLGYQASFAQKSRNSRLKDLEDKSSTNIYCTNIPIDWTEADLRRHFKPHRVVSEKISRDDKTGVSKEVGFARFESREIAENVLNDFHNIVKDDNVKLLLRFADTKAQKMLKQQSNERRAYRAGEYNYSVGAVQGCTPSPRTHRGQHSGSQLTPDSQGSFTSPAAMGHADPNWTPATSISSSYPLMKNSENSARHSSLSSNGLNALENTPVYHPQAFECRRAMTDISGGSSKTAVPGSPTIEPRSYMSTPRKETIIIKLETDTTSPTGPSRMETLTPSSGESIV